MISMIHTEFVITRLYLFQAKDPVPKNLRLMEPAIIISKNPSYKKTIVWFQKSIGWIL